MQRPKLSLLGRRRSAVGLPRTESFLQNRPNQAQDPIAADVFRALVRDGLRVAAGAALAGTEWVLLRQACAVGASRCHGLCPWHLARLAGE